ncbi:MAG: cation transporter [Deltaproteobacteria bacterium]|nr:cation transporter [Deltaproteobacteria bacterium]
MNPKIKEEVIAISVSFLLAVGKGLASFWTGSLALVASALDSLMDFFISSINLFSLKVADRPPDEDHAYGHGKAEAIAGFFQSLVILASVIALVYASVQRFRGGVPLQHLSGGIGIVLLSMVVGYWLSWRLQRQAASTGSVVLKTDSLHYAMDLYAYGGILLSFFLIKLTGWVWLDAIVTFLIALYIAVLAFRVGKQAVDELMDRELRPEIRQAVEEIVKRYYPEVLGMHNFKSRHAASKRFLQFHLVLKKELSFEQVHELEERIAGEIRRELGNVHVTIHADPEGTGLDQTDLM